MATQDPIPSAARGRFDQISRAVSVGFSASATGEPTGAAQFQTSAKLQAAE